MKRFTNLMLLTVVSVAMAVGQTPSIPQKQHLFNGKSYNLEQINIANSNVIGYAQNGKIIIPSDQMQQSDNTVTTDVNGNLTPFHVKPIQSPGMFTLRESVSRTNTPAWIATGDQMPISEQPEGEHRFYKRSGKAYVVNAQSQTEIDSQQGLLDVVFNHDTKKVYFKDFISENEIFDTWIEADLTDNGKTITIPMGQNVYYMPLTKSMLQLRVLTYDPMWGSYVIDEKVDNVVFDVDGDNLRLRDCSETRFVGTVYASDNFWTGHGDFNTVFTLFTDEIVVPPSNLKTEKYTLKATNHESRPVNTLINLGFDGNDVYAQGITLTYNPKAWIKGTRSGNTLTFPNGQFLGEYNETNIMYMCGVSSDGKYFEDVTFTLDDAGMTYSSDNFVLENGQKHSLEMYSTISEITLTKSQDINIITDIIESKPVGELKVYTRTGTGTSLTFYGQLIISKQQGTSINVVYGDDNSVYMQTPISMAKTRGNWVKGKRNGNKITFPLYQTLLYYPEEGYGVMTAMLKLLSYTGSQGQVYNEYEIDLDFTEVTFTVDDATGIISLDGTDRGSYAYGLVFTDDYTWSGYCDFKSVYTPFNDNIVYFPKNIEKETWAYQSNDIDGKYQARLVNVGIDNNDFYIGGLLTDFPSSVIRGTISGDKVKFDADQYLGLDYENMNRYFSVAEYTKNVDDSYMISHSTQIEFTIDKERKKITADGNSAVVLNIGPGFESLYYSSIDFNPSFSYYKESATTPENPTIINFDDRYIDVDGFGKLTCKIFPRDIDGNYINSEKLAYQVWIKQKNSAPEVYVFKKEKHEYLYEDMEVIPCEFTDDYDIEPFGAKVIIRETDFYDIGIQVINYCDNSETRSNRVWFKGGVEEGSASQTDIDEVIATTTKEVDYVVYYDINGICLAGPRKGFNIVKITYTDGTQETRKFIHR